MKRVREERGKECEEEGKEGGIRREERSTRDKRPRLRGVFRCPSDLPISEEEQEEERSLL